jgi:acyl-[acyl-carrier-protein]-phospholipid O-acyltransferase/long-chain-fatty-acid--[acyl-carrier-protein] ligase
MIALLRWLSRLLFRFEAFNEAVLQTPGPVLLVPNHVSWFDWALVGACLDDDWRFVTSSRMAATGPWWMRKIIANKRTFPVDPTSPYAVRHMAEYLAGGGRLVLFAEGRLSRTGALMKLYDGTGFLLHKTSAKVITCYLRGAFRLPLSPTPNWKRCLPKVTAHFSDVLTPPKVEHLGTAKARARLTDWLRDHMVRQQFETEMRCGEPTVPAAIVATSRQRPRRVALEDINGALTCRRLLVGADLLAGEFAKRLPPQQPRVGVLLPNVNATPVALLALWCLGKVPAVLNYSTGTATMLACAQLAGLKQIITSRAFLERAKLKLDPLTEAGLEFIYLEDVRGKISGAQKSAALLRAVFHPRSAIRPAGARQSPDSTAVILFTSGSEGAPKGVELSHTNLLANVRQMLAVCDIHDADRLFNALPIFHSFGLTVGTLVPLIRGCYVFLYPSPLHYRLVPTVVYDRDCTIMLGTNTFLNGYARKAHPYDFRSLRYLFAGAEKLQEATAATWAQRFGLRVFEGYGATECSPCISVCTALAPKHGSAGKLMPGMEFKLEPVEGVADGGRLFVRGPNVMTGYLNPDANAQFQKLGGWYDTGDIVRVDEQGFVFILGRLKRFAKISGEMVSLTAVEEALAGAFPQHGLRCQVAIVARPDADKGEVLVAVTNEPKLQLDDLRAALRARGLPNLCVPREVKFLRDIPRLGTGKINHRELEKLL